MVFKKIHKTDIFELGEKLPFELDIYNGLKMKDIWSRNRVFHFKCFTSREKLI